ncbi:hypothetical protein [Kosakonia sp. SMBL-WEM22]|uniref:hypothetical protein n=1 Tax=Kosakonia sp. SMBL-WEM22 TaxID=2725560 RepID=UPI001CB94FC7|nr:hypothetical protein [Kosakonia sp. SMBL-WEM22]
MITEVIVTILGLSAFVLVAYVGYVKQEKLMRDGRPILAKIIEVRPVSSDDAGNTTIAYTLNIEGRNIKGREKIDTFYAPQLQPGMDIKIMYIDDKNYMFVFKK